MSADAPTSEDDWTPTRFKQESPKEKILRKTRENPFVPIGLGLTTLVLGIGFYSFNKGNSKLSQTMMRLRVVAQGATVMAMMAGFAVSLSQEAERKKEREAERAKPN